MNMKLNQSKSNNKTGDAYPYMMFLFFIIGILWCGRIAFGRYIDKGTYTYIKYGSQKTETSENTWCHTTYADSFYECILGDGTKVVVTEYVKN